LSKEFWKSKTVLAAVVAIGCVAYQIVTGMEPGQPIKDMIEVNANQLIELISLGLVIWGRIVAQGPLSLK